MRFLGDTTGKMGFNRVWIRWIISCLSSMSFSVLMNGNSHSSNPSVVLDKVILSRHSFFVLCAEALVSCLNVDESSGSRHGIKLAISGLLSTSSAFKTTFSWCVSYLKSYSEVSGRQVINLLKHPVMFDANVPKNTKEGIKHVLGIKAKGGESLYLGPP